jgi:hypothetical protein
MALRDELRDGKSAGSPDAPRTWPANRSHTANTETIPHLVCKAFFVLIAGGVNIVEVRV